MKLILSTIFLLSQMDALEDLDSIALRCQTDKSSSFHHYTKVYSTFFEPIRTKRIKFLEIGIAKGSSVRMWEEYFPNAELHFIDCNYSTIEYFSARSTYHKADQGSSSDLNKFLHAAGGDFDIIIDDGGHRPHQQITSFKVLFPHLKSGGIYVVEDLHASYWANHDGGNSFSKPTIVNFLFSLIDNVNYVGNVTGCANQDLCPDSLKKNLTEFQEHIESIHFYSSLCFIIRK